MNGWIAKTVRIWSARRERNKGEYRVQSTEYRLFIVRKRKHAMSIAGEKSKEFAIRIVRLYRYLCREKREFILSKQLLRSGTSIGANLAESEWAISRSDFLSKIYIALKETSETKYWIELLYRTEYITKKQFDSIYQDAEAISKMLSATTKTMKGDGER